tara:strand:+ start:11368 stop:12204 length:837 start_codon:yes stop_codon:yes gene_type:complete
MIYKFIDNNGSEITVNSLSSLQALVESETVKKKTKVKAGLRGKWTTAENILELVFEQEKQEETEEAAVPEGDIKSFITSEEEKPIETVGKEKEIIEEKKPEKDEDDYEYVEEEVIEEVEVDEDEEKNEESSGDYYTDNEEKKDSKYDDENVIGLNFFQAIGTCLRKYFVFKGRASRSEYWFLQALLLPLYFILFVMENTTSDEGIIIAGIIGIIILLLLIPTLAVTIRRFHDINKSGWFVLLNFIPFIGWIIVLVMLVGKGTEGKNRFGDYPLKLKRK